jgi:N-acetylmuramoyl-L-alanine amidase
MATTHNVEQGETLYSIAKKHGFANWRAIYDHPTNEELRIKRPNPQVLQPGDLVQIPDPPTDSGLEVTLDSRTVVRRVRKGFETLRFTVLDTDMVPMPSADYTLSFTGGERKGKTDERGTLEESLPIDTAEVTLRVGSDEWKLAVGRLNPIDPDTNDKGLAGAKARLRNLGYFITNVDGEFSDDFRAALRRFQADHGLRSDGEMTDETREMLLAVHDS